MCPKMATSFSWVSICETPSFSVHKSMDAVVSAFPELELLSINHIERNIK